MIKLKNILELDKLVYSKNIIPKHKNSMDSGNGMFTGFNIEQFKSVPPNKNSSTNTFNELLELEKIIPTSAVKEQDKAKKYFRTHIEDLGLNYPKNEIDSIIKDSKSIIYQLKYHYNRPRPAQVAKAYGLKFHEEPLDTANTPSYPSGHAIQGRLLSRVLSSKYPEYTNDIMKLGDNVANSRLIAKVHFVSDSLFGLKIGDALFNFLEKSVD
jgi:hypothetical protein